MKNKLLNSLLILLMASLLIFDYFLIVYGMKILLHLNIDNTIGILTSFISLISIIIASYMVYYSVDKNYKNNVIIETKKSILESRNKYKDLEEKDRLLQRINEHEISDIMHVARGYADNIHTTLDIQKLTSDFLIREFEDIISTCKSIKRTEYFILADRNYDLLIVCDNLIIHSKNAQVSLIKEGNLLDPVFISNRFKEIYNESYSFLEKSDYITVSKTKLPYNIPDEFRTP